MQCSFYRMDLSKRDPSIRPVIIYLHGNSSSRIEGSKAAIFLINFEIKDIISKVKNEINTIKRIIDNNYKLKIKVNKLEYKKIIVFKNLLL